MLFVFIPSQAKADWLPFRLDHGHIIIDVEIAGEQAEAMLDSGAQANMISSRFIARYDLKLDKSGKMRAQGVNSVKTIPLYNNVPV